jgi:hypothetical protein
VPESHWYDIFVNHPTDWLLVLFNGILAAFTVRLFYATDKQATEMQASINAAVDSSKAAIAGNQIAVTNAEQQLRAYVTARDVHLTLHRHPAQQGAYGPIEGRIHTYALAAILHNGGQTPATNVKINVSCQKLAKSLPNDFAFPDSDLFGYGVIGPQGELHTPAIRIRENDLEPIDAASDWYLWGWVEYDDIFDGTSRHQTEFCFLVDRRRLVPTNDFWIGFVPYSRFNAVDGDCMRPIEPHTNRSG